MNNNVSTYRVEVCKNMATVLAVLCSQSIEVKCRDAIFFSIWWVVFRDRGNGVPKWSSIVTFNFILKRIIFRFSSFSLSHVYKELQGERPDNSRRRTRLHPNLQHTSWSNNMAHAREIRSREVYPWNEAFTWPILVSAIWNRSSKLHRAEVCTNGDEAFVGKNP